MDMTGKVAVVTGGGSGIGRALALAVAHRGASVAVADIQKTDAETVAAEIVGQGGRAVAVVCDVSERASILAMKREVNRALGKVSLLFANAGVTSFERMDVISEQDLDWVMQVDLMGVLYCIHAFVPDMVAARDGHIVATSSLSGLIPPLVPDHVPYAAAKAGIIAAMLNLRCELAQFNVGAMVLCPGPVTTRVFDCARSRPARFGGPSETRAETAVDITDFRPPEEVAEMTLLGMSQNRPMVITYDKLEPIFMEQFVKPSLEAFRASAEFDLKRAN
jgi:NAD(P)-dependent dehydrogenase (short-subunit alcohol dehydrogenase family)